MWSRPILLPWLAVVNQNYRHLQLYSTIKYLSGSTDKKLMFLKSSAKVYWIKNLLFHKKFLNVRSFFIKRGMDTFSESHLVLNHKENIDWVIGSLNSVYSDFVKLLDSFFPTFCSLLPSYFIIMMSSANVLNVPPKGKLWFLYLLLLFNLL